MQLTYNEGKSVVAERFIRILKTSIYENMTVRNCCSYLDYLDKLVGEYINTYHCSIGKKPIRADYQVIYANVASLTVFALC